MNATDQRSRIGRLLEHARDIDMGSTAFYKFMGLGLGIVANLGAVAIMTRRFGVEEYAAYALLASFLFLLPFADLGIGASVINVTSDFKSGFLSGKNVSAHVGKCFSILVIVGVLIVVLSLVAWETNGWQVILGSIGEVPSASFAATFTVVCIAFSLPFGLGSRIIQGLGRVRTNVQLGLLTPVISMSMLFALLLGDSRVGFFLLVPGISFLTVTVVTFFCALKLSGLGLPTGPKSWFAYKNDDYSIHRVAIPFFFISVGTAIGLQSHRLFLAHFGDASAVASYSLVAQFAGPLVAVLITTGQNLWSRYRIHSSVDKTISMFREHVILFGILGLSAAFLLWSTVSLSSRFLTDGKVQVSPILLLAAIGYLIVVSLHQPGAMYLTSPRGLTRQAVMVIVMSAVTMAGIFILYPVLSAASTYTAAALSMLVIQVVPTWIIVNSTMKRISSP